MRVIRKLVPVLSFVSLSTLSGAGSVWAAPKQSMPDPKLPAEVKPMHGLVGKWVGKAKLTAGPETQDLAVTMTCEPVAAGFAIACKTSMKGPGTVLEEFDLFGWDPQQKKYHFYATTSAGDTHDHVGDPPAADSSVLTFVYRGTLEGAPFQETITMSFDASCNHFDIAVQGEVGGQPAFAMAGFADRK